MFISDLEKGMSSEVGKFADNMNFESIMMNYKTILRYSDR